MTALFFVLGWLSRSLWERHRRGDVTLEPVIMDYTRILDWTRGGPGRQCASRMDDFRCSRDEGHSGDHASRHDSGGCVGWTAGRLDDQFIFTGASADPESLRKEGRL